MKKNSLFTPYPGKEGGGGSLPLEAVPMQDLKKHQTKGMFFRGGRGMRGSRKGYQNHGKWGKWYPNRYDQSLAVRLYVERVGKLRQQLYNNSVEVGPCDLLRVSFGLPINPRLGWFSDGDSRASGTASNGSDPPDPLQNFHRPAGVEIRMK